MKRTIAATLLALTATSAISAQEITALTGATVIDGKGGVTPNGVIVIEGDHITCVGAAGDCAIPAAATRHDMSGHFITPGLVDSHVHFGQTGWIDGRPDGIEAPDVYPYNETVAYARTNPDRWHKSYLCSGTTAVFDVGGQDWTVTDEHTTDTDRPDRVHVRAAGPLTTHASARNRFFVREDATDPLFLPMDSDEEVRANVARIKNIGGDAVKVWFLRPSDERREELEARLMLVGKLASEASLPMIVHATGLREAKAALKAGAGMLVHSVEDQPVDQEFIDLLLKNKATYAPTLVVGGMWTRAIASVALERAVEIDDPNGCVDAAIMDRITHPERLKPAFGDRMGVSTAMRALENVGLERATMYANLRRVFEAGGHVVMATDAGNPLTVHGPSVYWEMEAMQQAGLAPMDIITAATIKGAETMKMADRIGTIEAGKMADLIVMRDDPSTDVRNFRSLSHVMRKGVLKDQAELRVRQ